MGHMVLGYSIGYSIGFWCCIAPIPNDTAEAVTVDPGQPLGKRNLTVRWNWNQLDHLESKYVYNVAWDNNVMLEQTEMPLWCNLYRCLITCLLVVKEGSIDK